ncbi:MAG TPA: tRNA uridine-5-carboxymethylaminomethyl(34) synthesis GTPase MnmE [Gammaproteobacteria bacterium]|nr:tRNA uridine-5-carboxymethylaminomethyl(34) synthesis GTPase MnmE [Gammaproteobacteria bacterium]
MNPAREDTIAATGTAPGIGAVAIVRVSGPRALDIGRRLSGIEPRPRYAELCTFRAVSGEAIDEGLLLFFPGPRSFTGEDVVELQCHGGRVVSDTLLAQAFALGARPAEPGEFTLRAYLNDKLDLLQAEAVADLIASGSLQAARAALRSLDGEFSAAVADVQAALTSLRVRIEAWLDFPDEELPFDAAPQCITEIDRLLSMLDALTGRARSGRALRDGLSIAIAGPPNAGKSSLLNRLAGYDAAIVTDIPGTTRDPLREQLTLDGLPVTVVDTAGLRDTADPIEREGVRRARTEVARADRVLWLADARAAAATSLHEARAALGDDVPFTVVMNKVDLTAAPPRTFVLAGVPFVSLSALTGVGVDGLVAHLKQIAGLGAEVAGALSARRRHLDALARVRADLVTARAELQGALELTAEHLRRAQTALGELTGELTSDDLLGEIFATFCIGK